MIATQRKLTGPEGGWILTNRSKIRDTGSINYKIAASQAISAQRYCQIRFSRRISGPGPRA